MTQAKPIVCRVRLAGIRKIGPIPVAHIKQVAKHLNSVSLPPLAEQRRNWHLKMLPQQIKHGRLDCRGSMDRSSQIVGLQATAACVMVRELLLDSCEQFPERADCLPYDKRPDVF
jgi:hypothetical protein